MNKDMESNRLSELKYILDMKHEEIAMLKNERESLFDKFEENKNRITELYFEIEIKKLHIMNTKREQFVELKKTASDIAFIISVERINETCIAIVKKKLIENGYEERLKTEAVP